MAQITTGFGVFLVLLGIGAYVGSGAQSFTALIPAFFGLIFFSLGLLARRENLRKHVMHIALLVALLSLFGTFRGFTQLPALFLGEPVARPLAVAVQGIMTVASLLYILMGVRSFIQARRAS